MTTPTMNANAIAFPVPPPNDDDPVEIRDFTIRTKKIRFRIDDDVFEAKALLGLPMLQDLVQTSKTMGELMRSERYDAFFDLFDKLLYPESARRFRERGTSTGEDAIDLRRQLIPIMYYLLEKYGLRPTQPSSDSSTGSPSGDGGTSSTGGSSDVVSTSTPSPHTVSLT